MDAYWLQVQDKARDSQPESSDAQERQEGDAGDVPDLWYESVPHRERIERQSTATQVWPFGKYIH